jgi:hypothetical protein
MREVGMSQEELLGVFSSICTAVEEVSEKMVILLYARAYL